MKLLTFAVPCYNSQEYMGRCIESLLPGGDEVEILIIDDGSTDLTGDMADKYQEKYPNIIKAIHQENGGHGEAVNTGIKNASGLYFKVVDSDDRVDKAAYMQVLDKLRELIGGDTVLDMMLCNFVYDKEGARKKRVMHYEASVPVEELVTWDQTKHFRKGRYILMHSVIYRTKLLRKCGMELPKHTFYVDNIYVFEPLPYVKTLYYLPVNFYRYYIGREDQSVNEKVMISRIDQQIAVTKLMIDYFRDTRIENNRLRWYMRSYLEIMMVISSIFLIKAGDAEALAKKKQLWTYLRSRDLTTYFVIRHSMLGETINLPGKGGRRISIGGYKIAQMIVGFN